MSHFLFWLPLAVAQNRLHLDPIGSKYLLYIRFCSRLCVDNQGAGSQLCAIQPSRCSRFCVIAERCSVDSFGLCSLLCVGKPARHVANSAHRELGGPDKPLARERP